VISSGEYFSVPFSVTFGVAVWVEGGMVAAVCAAPAVVVTGVEKGSSDEVGDPL